MARKMTAEERRAMIAALADIREELGRIAVVKEDVFPEYTEDDFNALAICREFGI